LVGASSLTCTCLRSIHVVTRLAPWSGPWWNLFLMNYQIVCIVTSSSNNRNSSHAVPRWTPSLVLQGFRSPCNRLHTLARPPQLAVLEARNIGQTLCPRQLLHLARKWTPHSIRRFSPALFRGRFFLLSLNFAVSLCQDGPVLFSPKWSIEHSVK
jgi:hypothetical protein